MGFLALPDETLSQISALLPQSDLKSFRRVCRRFEAAAFDHVRMRIECCYDSEALTHNKKAIHRYGADSRVKTLAFYPDHFRRTRARKDEEQVERGLHLDWLTQYLQESNVDTLVLEGRYRPSAKWERWCKPVSRRRTGIAAKHLMVAGSKVDQKLKTVRLRGVAPDFCARFNDAQDDIYRLMKHVETFELDVLDHFDAGGNYPETWNPDHRYDEGLWTGEEVPTFLEQASNLRVLQLRIPARKRIRVDLVLEANYYPCLTWVELGGITANTAQLKTFLSKHKDTLTWIYLTDIYLASYLDPRIAPEDWAAFFTLMAGQLPACRKFICNGRLTHDSWGNTTPSHVFKYRGNMASKNTWLVDQYVRQPRDSPNVFKAKLEQTAGRWHDGMVYEIETDPEEPDQLRRV